MVEERLDAVELVLRGTGTGHGLYIWHSCANFICEQLCQFLVSACTKLAQLQQWLVQMLSVLLAQLC